MDFDIILSSLSLIENRSQYPHRGSPGFARVSRDGTVLHWLSLAEPGLTWDNTIENRSQQVKTSVATPGSAMLIAVL